jgi:hypothetical protein
MLSQQRQNNLSKSPFLKTLPKLPNKSLYKQTWQLTEVPNVCTKAHTNQTNEK